MVFLLTNILIGAITFMVLMAIPNERDIFENLKELEEILEGIENEKLKEFLINIVDYIFENKAQGSLLLLVVLSTPLLNIYCLFHYSKELFLYNKDQ